MPEPEMNGVTLLLLALAAAGRKLAIGPTLLRESRYLAIASMVVQN